MTNWKTGVPKCEKGKGSDEVLATVEHFGYQGRIIRRVIKAIYFGYHSVTLEDMGWNMYDGIPDNWEYFEEEDTWWIPEGWYEVADYFDEYSFFEITDKVIAWMHLPKAYTKGITDLSQCKSSMF